ncbi:alpha/beta hydrolase [Streptomyces barringtoniae]|uniref:alpha/beta hydrolase n=1 Tax=Streptomyces barringtoniae TaxID=2892029 RepID=UPI001E3CB235|nr:alpha/beta hydrolase [Streptomyces barringtoniae]MCC5476972.1 alpha/beta hydrolase family protein [Streptomyces barringtoniae]
MGPTHETAHSHPPKTTSFPATSPQPPTATAPHEGHPHPTTKAARVVRSGTRARPKSGCPPTDPQPYPDGTSHPTRRPRRGLRALLATLLTAAIAVPLSGAARRQIPAPAPAALPKLTATTLQSAYAANRADATRAADMAAAHGDTHRAAADRTLAAPSRHLLTFDGRGAGRATEVLGDLAHADHIAVLVPGSDTSLDTYARFHKAAAALYTDLTHRAPRGTRTAVVAWLGYETPATVSTTVTTTTRAEEAAPRLRAFVRDLRTATQPQAHLSLLCHSYGTAVCGRAAHGLDADDIVLVGSPGTGADSVAALHTRARVWAARGSEDWIANVPHVSATFFGTTVGLGADPVSRAFGARVFDAGDADHSGYFTPGSASLANLARITLGETSEVPRA